MAVLIRKKILFDDQEIETKVLEPSGVVSKSDRLHADKLDTFLKSRIPKIADEVLCEVQNEPSKIRRWHILGKKLKEIVDDRDLVLQSDLDNMLIWQAIWQYLPTSMMPGRSNVEKPYYEKQHKRQDHLSLCYEIAAFNWNQIKWIKTWAFVHEITARPSLLRDKRIFIALGNLIESLDEYPTVDEFREIMKHLTGSFPTKKYRDSHVLTDEEINLKVKAALRGRI